MHARLTLFLSVLAVCLFAQGKPFSPEFAANLARLGTPQTVQGSFTQVRHITSLGMDFTLKGEMAIEKNGRMLWKVDSPLRYICVMTRDTLKQWDGETGKVQEISAKQFPWLRILYDCQAAWISGDLHALSHFFVIAATEPERKLHLIPLQPETKTLFQKLEITFAEDFRGVASILLHETNGDTLHITFHDLKIDQPIPDSRWQLPPP